jgi:hypothetical protein
MLGGHRNLGLAVTEQGITAVLTSTSAGRPAVLHAASVAFTGDLNLEHPESLGRELRRALRQAGARASRCVIGLASSWVLAREKVLPATDEVSLRGALSIAAEREFASGPQDLSFDYSGAPAPGAGNVWTLLVAAPRRLLGQLEAMAKAAGLSVAAITSSAAALAGATTGKVPPGGRLVLCLLPRGVELAAQSPTGLRLIRHLPIRPDSPGPEADRLWGELRRILAVALTEGGAGDDRELLIWDAAGLGSGALKILADRLGLPVRLCGIGGDLGMTDATIPGEGGQFAQAAALACRNGAALEIDFLHSRLAPPARGRLSRRTVWAGAAAALALAISAWFFLDWRAAAREARDLQGRLTALNPARQEANTFVTRANFAGTWYDRRPEFLACLKEITLAFPEEGRVWATGLLIREDMQAVLHGNSVSNEAVLDVFKRLAANPRLTDVKLLSSRQAGGTSRDWSFAISMALRKGK